MSVTQLTYNIPGAGNITANVFSYTNTISSFFEEIGHLDKLRKVNQLGYLRNNFEGAHHSRYEYVFLQWALTSELCKQPKSNDGLRSSKKYFGRISYLSKYPSTGEILQCLSLLTNIGFQTGTFASNRAWLKLLFDNKLALTSFLKGLDPIDRNDLIRVVQNFDYYKFQHYITLFLLQRYKGKDKELVTFCKTLLRSYLNRKDSKAEERKIWSIFYNIRRISYVVLDSFYAPIPFNLDLTSILLGFNSLYKDLFIQSSVQTTAIVQIEKTLQESVYISPDSCLTTAYFTAEEYKKLKSIDFIGNRITEIYKLIKIDKKSAKRIYYEYEKPQWNSVDSLHLSFSKLEKSPWIAKKAVAIELSIREKVSNKSALIGFLSNPRKEKFRITFALKKSNPITELRQSLKAVTQLIALERTFYKYQTSDKIDNYKKILSYLLIKIFGADKRFILESHLKYVNPIVIVDRASRIKKHFNNYLHKIRKLPPDDIFEVTQTVELFNRLNSRKLSITFIGATKVFKDDDENESAEFDGVIILPTANLKETFMYVLEAKNYNNGFTRARSQLTKRLDQNLPSIFKYEIKRLNGRTAYAEIKLK